MPDQSSAADEHALIQEITAPLAAIPDNAVPAVADADFPIVLRGYDRFAVDSYVRRTSQLVAELQATRSPEAAIRRALERVGGEVSGILQRAHETSDQITSQSRREAEERMEVARREANQMTAEAEARLRELDAETDRIWAERRRIVEDARQLAQELVTLADAAIERFPAAADGEARDSTAPTLPRSEEPESDQLDPGATAPFASLDSDEGTHELFDQEPEPADPEGDTLEPELGSAEPSPGRAQPDPDPVGDETVPVDYEPETMEHEAVWLNPDRPLPERPEPSGPEAPEQAAN